MDQPTAKKTHTRFRLGLMARIRAWFLTGVIVTAPISLTIYLTYSFVAWVDRNVALLIPESVQHLNEVPFGIPGLGIVLGAAGLTLIGFLTANYLGRTLISLSERILDRMPVVRSIYGALKQIFETIFAQSSSSFRQVVLVEWPRRDMWSIAFVANETGGEVGQLSGGDSLSIFIPATPNPTSGFLMFVPRQDVRFLSMSVEEAMRYVISIGTAVPPEKAAELQPERK
jgi:uncharacterized membrane protein